MTIDQKITRKCCVCSMNEITIFQEEMLALGWHYRWTVNDIVTLQWYCPKHTDVWEQSYQDELKQLNKRYGR